MRSRPWSGGRIKSVSEVLLEASCFPPEASEVPHSVCVLRQPKRGTLAIGGRGQPARGQTRSAACRLDSRTTTQSMTTRGLATPSCTAVPNAAAASAAARRRRRV